MLRHLLCAGALLALVNCVSDIPGYECNDPQKKAAAVAQRTSCIQKFCSSDPTAACACVADGKDFNRLSCACTDSLSAAAEATVCGGGYDVKGDADCSLTNLELSSALATAPCKACTNKYECRAGKICRDSACVDGCESDNDCVNPGKSYICVSSACIEGCNSDLDCQVAAGGGLMHYCRATICHDGCANDLACELWQTCEAGACGGKACTDDSFCYGHRCVAGRCD